MKNLLGRLMGRSYDELRQTATTLQLPPTKVGQNDLAVLLYRELMDETAIKWVWGELGPKEHWFINWLMEQRAMTAFVDTLPITLESSPEEVQSMLNYLSRRGIVDIEDVLARNNKVVTSQYRYATRGNVAEGAEKRPAVSIAAEIARVLKKIGAEMTEPPRFDQPLSKLLEYYELAQLEQVALTWKLKFAQPAYYKEEVADVLLEALAHPERVREMLINLPPAAQLIYKQVEQHNGRLSLDALRKVAGLPESEFRQNLRLLGQRFLVLETYSAAQRYFFIPKDILQPEEQPQAAPPPLATMLGEPARTESQPYYTLAWDILNVVVYIKQNRFNLVAQDEARLPKRIAKKLNELLLVPEPVETTAHRLNFILHLALKQELLRITPSRDQMLPGPKLDEWVQRGFGGQMRQLVRQWQDDREWFEPAAYAAGFWWAGNITLGRKKVLGKLQELDAGRWYTFDSLLAYFEVADPYLFFRTKQEAVRFMGGYRNLNTFSQNWRQREGRVVVNIVTAGLHWLGLVDVGYDDDNHAVAFRLRGEAAGLLNEAVPLPITPGDKTLLLQPNFEVLVFAPESAPLWNLLQFADLARHDRVSAYTISRDSVQRGLEQGMSATAIQQFLQAQSQREVPQNVARSIEDWARAVKRVRLSAVTLLEVDDPTVLDELAAGRKTSGYVLRRLSPTAALVRLPEISAHARESAMTKVAKALRTAGYAAIADDVAATNGSKDIEP